MQLNEDLFQRSTATRHHPSTDRKSDRLTWTHTAPMGSTGWSQRDTLTTGHGHCRDNRRQHTTEVEQIVRSLAARGYSLHGFGIKVTGLSRYAEALSSSDSASWSRQGRYVPGCSPSHRSESNCVHFALAWHARLLTSLRPDERDQHTRRQRAALRQSTQERPGGARPTKRGRTRPPQRAVRTNTGPRPRQVLARPPHRSRVTAHVNKECR